MVSLSCCFRRTARALESGRVVARLAQGLGTSIFFLAAAVLAAAEWKPVDPQDLASKTPVVEKDADAEALFWEVKVADEAQGGYPQSVLWHYLRIKIYTDRGRQAQRTVEIPFFGRTSISDIAGRTIQPDGTTLDLKRDSIFERVVMKSGGFKVRVKSFAMPGVETGGIIEYRWKETRQDQLANYLRLYFSREIPVQFVKYSIKPLNHPYFPYGMRTMMFQAKSSPFQREPDGFYSTSMGNVPAFREEPRMPPEDQVRPWMLIYYSEDKNLKPEQFWSEHGKEVYKTFKPRMKADGKVKEVAASVTSDAKTPEEKIECIFRYCRKSLKNVDSGRVSTEERDAKKENKTAGDTLRQGIGNSLDINLAFAALATAAGFDARLAKLADRGDTFFDRNFTDAYFLRTYNIAVKVNGNWRFFDPGTAQVPYGMLRWQEEGGHALISDPKEPVFVTTPLTAAATSRKKRDAMLRLREDGTLEGTVQIVYTGHLGTVRKANLEGESQAEREESVRREFQEQMSTAEVSAVNIENADDPEKPLTIRCSIKVPGYAQRTGKRLFVQPSFFQRNVPAVFPAATRTYPVYFRYPWSELDKVIIQLPEGYTLDHADAPPNLPFRPVGSYAVKIGVTADHQLVYQRDFTFGEGGTLFYPQASYAQLKKVFDLVYEADNHTIPLKVSAPVGTR